MADRYVDKQIKVLELIRKEKFRGDAISGHALKITDDELAKILEEFQQSNLLKVQQKDLLNSSDEYREYDDILMYYMVTDEEELAKLLMELKKNHPRHDKPIIREKTLEKIAKHFSNLETKSEIIALLKKSGAPRLLIEGQHIQWKMIFAVLNYYALSAKKEDFQIFKKIIGEFTHPLMFDGNKKEAQGMVDMLNSLLEYDGFVIRDGILVQEKKSDSAISTRPIENLQPQNDVMSITLKDSKLIINKHTGKIKLNDIGNILNPESQEFKTLTKLAGSRHYMATYDDLIKGIPNKTDKRNLGFVIRNIKNALGILPKKTAKNKDIFRNVKKYGYRLIT